jgi:hypothetical protein
VKDVLAEENGAAILMRLMAGCCGIALLRFFAWREVASSVDGSLFLIAGFLGYVLAAFHSCSYFCYAIAAAASCGLVAIILLALALVLPDFSGFSVFTRQRFIVLLLFVRNVGLVFATAGAALSFRSRPKVSV